MHNINNILNLLKYWILQNKLSLLSHFWNIIFAIIIIILGFKISTIIINTIQNIFKNRNIDPITIGFISNILKYSLFIFVIVTALSSVGFKTSSIVAAFGTIGLVIGLAWQSALANVASGLLIITLRIFQIGDYINLNNIIGKIINVEIFCTFLKTLDGSIVSVPNSKILSENIINLSKSHEYRNKITLGLSRIITENDIQTIRKILLDNVSISNEIIKNSVVDIVLNEITINSINFTIFFWINDFMYKKEICSNLINQIKQSLEKYKPSCVLWINND
ncbi:mechanosensitive ion channel domain-containing protein [Enterobacteriaceae endosymbiont of Macroplea appendiculata]|uniref:mechanosensitive ion channel domain-containing protein n=1 Tax=Enterobacteriaceae endosymbiont of Macroplea appendiculata TaxID=2675790 RepID=UPI001449826B|nr:mechanosensitive ion channel domain-containing protein [Enterobacteriaceae endosymbiont of Macroplea appendiculata]QJC30754.1 mechanosensitive ion channel [Enterobacteriaceae endosymbiont of Macroplea appendiculata]